ncbi:MAG: hypothetical protein QM632_06535 [Micrococcaceae bacterium]
MAVNRRDGNMGELSLELLPEFSFISSEVAEIYKRQIQIINNRVDNSYINLKYIVKVEASLEQCLRDLRNSLQKVSPSAALNVLPSSAGMYYQDFGLNRVFPEAKCAWLIGVFGAGTVNSKNAILEVYTNYQKWCSTRIVLGFLRQFLEKSDSLENFRESAISNNILPTESKMRLIIDKLCSYAADWAEKNLIEDYSLNGDTARLISKNYGMASDYIQAAHNQGQIADQIHINQLLLEDVPSSLIKVLTASKENATNKKLTDALENEHSTLFPIVFLDEKYFILDRVSWQIKRETTFINLIMNKTAEEKRKKEGEVLEYVTKRILQEYGPDDFSWSTGQYLTPESQTDRSNPVEVDLVGLSQRNLIIGECKSNRVSKNYKNARINFYQKILKKATDQVHNVFKLWDEGWRIKGLLIREVEKKEGMIVTLSNYASTVWQSSQLNVRNRKANFPILPIHSLAFVCLLLEDSTQFADYLEIRKKMVSLNFHGFDELEYLLFFFNPDEDIKDYSSENLQTRIFAQYELNQEFAMTFDPFDITDKNRRENFLLNIRKNITKVNFI